MSMKSSFLASLVLLSSALLLTGKVSRSSVPLSPYKRLYATIEKNETKPLAVHPPLSLFYYPIAASPITPRQARQSGDDTDSGCGQTPASRDGRDGLPGPPGPQGLAGTATDH